MNVIVSDHALLRYIERVHGLDLEPLRKEIKNIITLGVVTGARNVINDGFVYSIKRRRNGDCVVATILTPGMREKARNWKPNRNPQQKELT